MLTGPITIGDADGGGLARDVTLRLGAVGVIDTSQWIPRIQSDATLELIDGIGLVELELEGGKLYSEGNFEAELIRLFASSHRAVVQGGWNTPGTTQVDVVQLADGAADPDLQMFLTRPGPGTLRIRGPGQAQLYGEAVAGEGPLEVEDATLTLHRAATPQSALPRFSATDAQVVVEQPQQFGADCELRLTHSTVLVSKSMDQSLGGMTLEDAEIGVSTAELFVNGDIDAGGDCTIAPNVQMGGSSCCVQTANGATLTLGNINASQLSFSHQGTVDADVLSGSFFSYDGTLRVSESLDALSVVDGKLEVPAAFPGSALEVTDFLSIGVDGQLGMTIDSETVHSRIRGTGPQSRFQLEGQLMVELAPDYTVQAGDEFVLVEIADIDGAANQILLPDSPAPDLIWTVEVGPFGSSQRIVLRAVPLDGAELSLWDGSLSEPVSTPLGLDGVTSLDLQPLGFDDLRVTGVLIGGLQAETSTRVGVRLYDVSSQSLLGTADRVLQPTAEPQSVVFPMDVLLQPLDLVRVVLYSEDPLGVRVSLAPAFPYPGSSVHQVVNAHRAIGQGDVIPRTPTDEIFEASLTLFDATATAVEDSPALPRELTSPTATPSPFNLATAISFELPRDSYVELQVYDLRGRKIVDLGGEQMRAGHREIVWRGRDANGRVVASGTYFLRLSTEAGTRVGRVALIK